MKNKHNYDDLIANFNKVSIPEAAYALGLIWADGTITKYKVSINLVQGDMEEIKPIFYKIGNWKNRLFISKTYAEWKPQIFLEAYSKKLSEFFIENDFLIKTYVAPSKILSKIPENLKHYFWLGFFDGDGCLCISKRSHKLTLAASVNYDWGESVKLFNKIGSKFFIRRGVRGKGSASVFFADDKLSVLRFGQYIYRNHKKDKIGLTRKYKKYLSIIESCKNFIDFKVCVSYNSTYKKSNKKFVVGITSNKNKIPHPRFNTFEEAFKEKLKLIKQFNTLEYKLRNLINYWPEMV